MFASVQLQARDGWTAAYKVIVDTGNPISIIPHFIWTQAEIRPLFHKKVSFQGIGSGRVSGELAEVGLVFVDPRRVSPPIKAKAFLLEDDTVPFLIGFEDVLTSVRLVSDYDTGRSYLEWK